MMRNVKSLSWFNTFEIPRRQGPHIRRYEDTRQVRSGSMPDGAAAGCRPAPTIGSGAEV